ncbi:phage tail protein [Vibrio sp. ER1A]|uniref:phage tail protein n=1 Tax=Vibrio sp. ER1A TaxID=1517681 RepID=UPI0004DCF279|nr:phage tail protein [Vibrio sp. ER1A]KFA98772.1 hypothetical protein HW45_07030 [Vibrio sp. ER1A]
MSDVMMALGEYRFSIDTAALQTLSETHSWRWADHNVAGQKPKSEFIGADLSTINLQGTIYPHYRGGLGQTDAMKAEGDKGEPLRMVDGLGRDWGNWTIRELQVDRSKLWRQGIALKMDFTIELKEHANEESAP